MAFHKSNFGSFGHGVCDMNGYVPEATDTDPFAFAIDHGTERTHNADGSLTEYGEWWAEEGFAEWKARAIAATEESAAGLEEWRTANV